MVAIEHLVSPSPLPPAPPTHPTKSLSVLSWNVLLPNSVDGWWNYKMYSPPLDASSAHMAEWSHRSSLIRQRVELINADVVCLQEVSPKSFEEDFAFMADELGYDGVELFRRGRFRPATFWRKSTVDLAAPPVHKDRTLLTTFRHVNNNSDVDEGVNWHVLNCHLQAGKQGGRRVRQVHEGVGAAVKLARRLKEKNPASPLLVVCGDFNGGPECGAVRYLEDGSVGPDFLEDGEAVTSKMKKMALSAPLTDVPNQDLGRGPAPNTLVVQELISLLIEEGTDDTPSLSADVLERLERIYYRYATHSDGAEGTKAMGRPDVERWLIEINGQVGRGSEFRRAAREMGYVDPPEPETAGNDGGSDASGGQQEQQLKVEQPRIALPEDGVLSLEGFCRVYEGELREGKFWGIAWDLATMGETLPDKGVFEARYDRMYCSQSVRPTAVLDTLSSKPCPNKEEPSDHLPIAARFQLN